MLDASGRQDPAATHTTHVYLCVVTCSWHVGGTFVLQDLVLQEDDTGDANI